MTVPAPDADRLITAPSDRKRAILDVIAQARERLVLSLFRCNEPDIFAELGRAVQRGVGVDVLVTSNAKGGKAKITKLWDRLKDTGARLHAYHDPVVKYHAKYLVADDGPAVVASLNFTRKCFDRTLDALVVTSDSAVVDTLHRMFEADRQGLRLPDATSPRLVIGPELARRQLTDLINAAASTIRLIDAKLADPDLITLLQRRAAAGLTVELFGAKKIAGLKSHGKVMLLDDRTAVVGSMALTALSLEFRREVAIVVEAPAAIAAIQELFSAARAAGAGAPLSRG